MPTAHESEASMIAASLSDWPRPKERASDLQSLRWRQPTTLAAVLSLGELEALRIAVAGAPRPEYERSIEHGHHRRAECLERPGEWCRGIGNHPGRCDSCPTRHGDLHRLLRVLDEAVRLRQEWDGAMWGPRNPLVS